MAIGDGKDDIQVRQPEPVRLCLLVARASVNPAGEILKLANMKSYIYSWLVEKVISKSREELRLLLPGVESCIF
jgi:hypothetical protein